MKTKKDQKVISISQEFIKKSKKQLQGKMFSSILTNIAEKLSGLNPIKTFIKYALDKFLNELINNEIRLEDFKNGCLNLASIGFNVDNVNTKHLVSSPYMMHSGSIGNLKIQLPNLAELVTKSIQIEANQILIELKPNKDFYKSFKERMEEIQENSLFEIDDSLPGEELSENNPMDFFKETLKKILLNIKIKVQNIVIKLYMNNPQDKQKRTPYCIMMRIPIINVHKNTGTKTNPSPNVEEIKLDIEIPQFTIHLINQKSKVPEFDNQKFKKSDFPFYYPSVNHPTTILLFGLVDFKNVNIETDPKIPRLTICIATDTKKSTKDIKIEAKTSRIELMADPIQIKILSRFFHQLKEFKNILGFIKNEFIHAHNSSIEMPVNKKNKSSEIKHEDVFSSICMSAWQKQTQIKQKKTPSFIDKALKESSDLEQSVNKFNQVFQKQLQSKNIMSQVSQEMTSELRVINFDKRVQINMEVSSVYIYLLKKVCQGAYYRKWMDQSDQFQINQAVPTSYFMLSLERMRLKIDDKQNLLKVQVSKLKLQNIKLFQNRTNFNLSISEDEFVDVQASNVFYAVNQQPVQNNIRDYKPGKGEHYCVEQILRISQKPSENYESQKLRKYNFLPKPLDINEYDRSLHKPGFKFLSNNKSQTPVLRFQVLQVAVSTNAQIIRELLDVYFPIEEFKKLAQTIKSQEIVQPQPFQHVEPMNRKKFQPKSLLESHYNFIGQHVAVEEYIQSKKKPLIQVSIQQVSLGFYESPSQHFQDLILRQKSNEHHAQTLCFCSINRKGIYLQTYDIKFQNNNPNSSISLKRIVVGYIELMNSKISRIKGLLNISSSKQPLRVIIEKNPTTLTQNIFVHLSDFSLNIQQKYTLSCIELVKSQILIAEQIYYYFHHLKYEMELIQKKSQSFTKKNRKNQQQYEKKVQAYVEIFHATVLKAEIYMKHIYVHTQTDQFLLKLSTVVCSIRENVQLFLSVMKNQQMLVSEYIETERRYPFTKDSNIIFEIHDDTYKQQAFDLGDKKGFFKVLSQTSGSLLFNISKTSIVDQSQVFSRQKQLIMRGSKFQFNKKPSLRQGCQNMSNVTEIISEEQQHKKIIINVSNPIYIFANNVLRLLEKKEQFKNFVWEVKELIIQISLETKVFSKPERKTSTDSDIDKVEEMNIKLSSGKINIDIRPTFLQNTLNKNQKNPQLHFQANYQKQIFFSSSRSYLQLQWQTIDAYIQKRIQKSNFKGSFNLKYFFLQHEERKLQTNPLFIHEKHLKDLGFIEILSLNNLKFNTDIIKQTLRFNLFQLSSLAVNLSLSTVAYLMLHWQHFINHNIKKNFGTTSKEEEQKFQLLQEKSNQSFQNIVIPQQLHGQIAEQIQDLTNGYQIYKKKNQFKENSESSFKAKPFAEVKEQEQIKLFIRELKIKQMKFKFYSGNDFEFVSFDSVNDTSSKKRQRIDNSQIFNYIELRADLLSVSLKVNQKRTESFVKVQNFQINYSKNKVEKNSMKNWFVSNSSNSEQQLFPVMRSLNTIKIILDIDEEAIHFKIGKTSFQIGFTSEILDLVSQFKSVRSQIEQTGRKKIYEKKETIAEKSPKQTQKLAKTKMILVHIPENRLNFRLIYKGITILSNQVINAAEFMLHEESNRPQKMTKLVENWVKKLILENIGTLISGTTFNLLGDVIKEILKLVKFLLSCIFRPGSIVDEE